MPLKPLQTAKRVGIKWTPSPEMANRFIEPLVEKRHYDILRREGRTVLNSVAIDDFNGMHVGQAAQFDDQIREVWPRAHLTHAHIDNIERTYIEQTNKYRIKYHLENPDAQKQQRLVGHSTLLADSILSPQDQARYRNLQESVFFEVPAQLLSAPPGRSEEFLDEQLTIMRNQLGDQAIKSVSWLTNPQMYVVTYQPHEAMKLAELLDWHRSNSPN